MFFLKSFVKMGLRVEIHMHQGVSENKGHEIYILNSRLYVYLIKYYSLLKKEVTMYAVIRHYHFKPADGQKIDQLIQEEFVPILKKAKGFVRYYWLDTGSGEGASLSVFLDKAGADESILLAADFVKANLSELIIQKPEVIEGPVKAHD
jgi:hypothetical protein